MSEIIVILLLVACVVWIEAANGPNDETNNKSYPDKNENIGKILDRMEWAAIRHVRVRYVTKFLLWGVWLTFFCSFLFLGKLPTPGIFFRNWILTTISLLCLSGFYYWHSDKFSEYGILKGICILRHRLGVKAGDHNLLSPLPHKVKGSEAPFVFTAKGYSLGYLDMT